MSNIEWLDTFSVLLAFIFISQNEQGSQHLRALTARMFHLRISVHGKCWKQWEEWENCLLSNTGRGEYCLSPAICVRSTSLPTFCLMDRNGIGRLNGDRNWVLVQG